MSVICQCPSCKAKYQVGDQYAGRTVKCPKCSAAVVVPAVAQRPQVQPVRQPRPRRRGRGQGSSCAPSKADCRGDGGQLVEDPPAEPARGHLLDENRGPLPFA